MMFLRKLCLVGTGVCAVCIARSAQFVKSTAGISDDESDSDGDDRFQIDHITKRGLRLKMVQVFFRHGARTPLNLIPNPKNIPELEQVWDKETLFSGGEGLLAHYVVKGLDGGAMPESRLDAVYREVLFKGGTFAGQLTTKGKQQMHALGGVYKKYYIDTLQFLDPKFTPEHIYIRSTNVNRTIESAACVLAGMFGNHIKKKDPVSILVASSTDEILYPNAYFCNRFAAINKNLWNDNDTMPGMRHSRRQLQDMLGIPQNERLDIVKLRDVLACQKVHGIQTMDILNSLSDFIDKCAVDLMNYYVCRPGKHRLELLQMAGGRVVQMVNDNIQQAVQKENFKKFHMYSCHDTMLISVLNGLEIYDNQWPPYAADLAFELYEDKQGAHYVRTMYLGKEKCIFQSKEAIIPLEQFLELTSKVAILKSDYTALCADVATL